MKIWYKPPIYAFIHILSGIVGYFYPAVLLGVFAYHSIQYYLDVRFFAFDCEIREGNSLEHTMLKLSEVCIGYILAAITRSMASNTT